MRKKFAIVCQVGVVLLGLGLTQIQAQVELPESGHLAGAMNSAAAENGNEFLFFPWPPGIPAKTVQSGWIEIEFAESDGTRVPFSVTFRGRGSDAMTQFATGQTMVFTDEVIVGTGAEGLLNLETGEIESIVVSLAFENSIISTFGKLNRLFATLGQTYPPDPALLPPGLPPGFVSAEASFVYGSGGKIVGFQFVGQSAIPIGILGFLPFLPQYSFGPGGQGFFSNPTFCSPETPPGECPSNETHPEGLPLGIDALIHPNVLLLTNELREVPVEPQVPTCAPTARADSVVVELGGEIYQIGGTGRGVDRRWVEIYDPATGLWRQGPSLPVAVSDAQGAAADGKIYVVGGRRQAGGPASALLQVFDLATDTWSQQTPAPAPIADGVAVTLSDRLYVLSGRTNRPNGSPSGNLRFSDVVQVYDISSDTWAQFPALLDGSRLYASRASAVGFGSEIYLINGRLPGGRVSHQVAILDTTSHHFRQGPPTPQAVYDGAAVRVGQRIFLAGGRHTVRGPSRAGMQVFETNLGIWKQAHDQPVPLAASAAISADGVAYFFGGRAMTGSDSFPGAARGVVQAFDPARGWQVCNDHPIFTSGDIFSSAGLAASPRQLSPGAQASISGHHLADVQAFATLGENVPTELGGVRVTIDGDEAPILAVDPNRIDFQIPYSVATGDKAEVRVYREGSAAEAPAVEVPMVDVAPSLFVQSCGRIRDLTLLDGAFALACHTDGSLNYTRNSVQPGDRLFLQMTGLGMTDAALGTGERAPGDTPVSALMLPEVLIQGADGQMREATVLSATLAPGEVGIYDVEILVPSQVREGSRVFVEASAGEITSNRGTISIGRLIAGAAAVPCLRDTQPLFRACAPLPPVGP